MMKKLHLNIVSPEKELFNGEVESVTLPGTIGLFFYPAAACTDCIIVGNGEIDLRNGR
mgnify:CR=1 FL=1